MDVRQALLKEPQREQGGKLAIERFEFQAAWGLSRVLDLFRQGADFGIAFEFHDDVLQLDSMSSPTKVTFFQVKTQKNWQMDAFWDFGSEARRESKRSLGREESLLRREDVR